MKQKDKHPPNEVEVDKKEREERASIGKRGPSGKERSRTNTPDNKDRKEQKHHAKFNRLNGDNHQGSRWGITPGGEIRSPRSDRTEGDLGRRTTQGTPLTINQIIKAPKHRIIIELYAGTQVPRYTVMG